MLTKKLHCSNLEHSGEQGSYFCKEEECINNNPFCVLCVHHNHKLHRIEPIKLTVNKMQNETAQTGENLQLLAQIDTYKEKIHTLCSQVEDKEMNKALGHAIQHYLTNLLKNIDLDEAEKLQAHFGGEEGLGQTGLLNKIIEFQKKYHEEGETEDNDNSKISASFRKIIEDIKEKCQIFDDLIKKGQIDSFTSEIFVASNKKFHFSSKDKHSRLELEGENGIKILDEYCTYNYIGLCHPKLSLKKTQTITFQLKTLTSYVSIGICNKDKISANYELNTQAAGHGCHHISYDGYCWCDGGSENEQYIGWYFNQGDKVTLTFNPVEKSLKFVKNSEVTQAKEIKVNFSKNDKLYFGISLNSTPEEIVIVD